MNPFNFFLLIYWRYFASPINYAKHLGVKVGDYTTISIRKSCPDYTLCIHTYSWRR